MVEVIFRIVKIITALSLQVLSFSLLFWAFNLNPHFSSKHVAYFLGICILVYLFVSYSLALFKQAFKQNIKPRHTEILDEDEILKHKKHD